MLSVSMQTIEEEYQQTKYTINYPEIEDKVALKINEKIYQDIQSFKDFIQMYYQNPFE